MMGGRDDEARNRRAEAETEVACDSSERCRCGALLRRDQGLRSGLGLGDAPTNSKPATPPTAEQTKPCQGRSTNAKPP